MSDALAPQLLGDLERAGTVETMSFDGDRIDVVWQPFSLADESAALSSPLVARKLVNA